MPDGPVTPRNVPPTNTSVPDCAAPYTSLPDGMSSPEKDDQDRPFQPAIPPALPLPAVSNDPAAYI